MDISVRPVSSPDEMSQIKKWILKNHYIKRWPIAVQERLGIYADGNLIGTILYGIGGRPQQAEDLFDPGTMSNNQIWELQRLFITDEAKKKIPNLASVSIARGNEYVRTNSKTKDGKPVKGVVTYADANVGHTGKVYKATNAAFLGQQRPLPFFTVTSPNGVSVEARTLGKQQAKKLIDSGYKIKRHLGQGKYKYLYALGSNQRERDALLSKLKVPMYSYTDGESKPQEVPNIARQKAQQQTRTPQQTAPVDRQSILRKLLNSTVNNPETGNKILVQTALKYDKNHPAYKTALGMVNAYARRYNLNLKPR